MGSAEETFRVLSFQFWKINFSVIDIVQMKLNEKEK